MNPYKSTQKDTSMSISAVHSAPPQPAHFSPIGVVGLIVMVVVAFFASQLIGLYAAAKLIVADADELNIGELLLLGGSHGTAVSVSVIISFVLLTLLTWLVVRSKVNSTQQVFAYLGWRRFSRYTAMQALSLLLIFTVLNEFLSVYFERDPMDFVTPLFASTDSKWLLIWVIVLVAPLYEELVFRGLLWTAIAEQFDRRRGIILASMVTSLLFAFIHQQYQLYEMATIMVLALIFCYARVKSGSILLPMLLHVVNNGLAMLIYFNLSA